jgi:hypothetical protein
MKSAYKIHVNQSSTNAYGRITFLGFQPLYREKSKPKVIKRETRQVDSRGQDREILVDGKSCPIVTTTKSHFIVRMPDRTYGQFDIKTRQYAGAIPCY